MHHAKFGSDLIVDKAQTISREKIGQATGRLNDENLVAVNRALAVFPGFARICAGFAIPDQLYGYPPVVRSLLMDRVTLQAFKAQWGVEGKPT
ncbi:MAG: hypothetical protein WCH04_12055 [Gammaproteobacteria bacterium]